MKHQYQRIIQLLAEDLIDYKAVALFFAKNHPDLFLHAVGGKPTPEEIANECISKSETRIECIKKIRTIHNTTLREGKELADRYYGPYRAPDEFDRIRSASAEAEQDHIEEQWKG